MTFFAQPGTDFPLALLGMGNQLLDFEWIPEDSRWNALDINGSRAHFEA